MTATEITWIATLVEADELPAASTLARTLGWTPLISNSAQVMFQTPRGDVVEYCTMEHPAPAHLFAHHRTAVGFAVDDLDATSRELTASGFRAAGGVTDAGAVRFQHFSGPGGGIFGLIASSGPAT
jgi:hypothetical protein